MYVCCNSNIQFIFKQTKRKKQTEKSLFIPQLVSRVLLADPEMRPKAKIVLEKAMELNKNYMPAILLLVELLLDEENAEEAIKLMKRVILVQPTSNLMSMLADIYMSTNEPMHAVEYYTKALKYASSFSDSRYRASFIVYCVLF